MIDRRVWSTAACNSQPCVVRDYGSMDFLTPCVRSRGYRSTMIYKDACMYWWRLSGDGKHSSDDTRAVLASWNRVSCDGQLILLMSRSRRFTTWHQSKLRWQQLRRVLLECHRTIYFVSRCRSITGVVGALVLSAQIDSTVLPGWHYLQTAACFSLSATHSHAQDVLQAQYK